MDTKQIIPDSIMQKLYDSVPVPQACPWYWYRFLIQNIPVYPFDCRSLRTNPPEQVQYIPFGGNCQRSF